jgi:hypothetical protein
MVACTESPAARGCPQTTGGLHLRTSTLPDSSAPTGTLSCGRLGTPSSSGAKFGLDDFQPRGGAIQLGLDRGHLGHHGVHALALGLELATDLLAQAVALACSSSVRVCMRLALVLQRREGGHIEVGLRVLALLKACNDGVEVFTEGGMSSIRQF